VSDRSGKGWAFVTIAAAVISSPWLLQKKNPPTEIRITWPASLQPMSSAQSAPSVVNPLVDPKAESPPPLASPVGSQRYLNGSELAGLTRWQLDIIRNEIYAWHGRRFQRADLQAYFDKQAWYRPVYAPDGFPEGILTPIERANVDLIANYQQTR
jgi:serine/threonine-protein kinase